MDGPGSIKKDKVLLIGHNPENEKILTDIISPFYEVIISNEESQIIEWLQDKENVISTAILDMGVAISIIESIRSIPSLENFPLLVSTLHGSGQIENELLELEVVDFLKQPFDARRVLNRIKTCIKLFNANKIIFELERDELTGLYTRKAFLRRAEQVRDENPKKKFAILAFDFDNFKSSNTLYGEQKCNEFLAYAAKRLKGLIPKSIVGRYGGDQFILFFNYEGESVDVERIKYLTKSILETAPIPHQIVKTGINAPISHDLPIVVCCDRAFLAIQQIKGIYGKDIAFFESELQKHLLDEQRINETMEAALENNEFKVYYQPKHETITGKIVGAEALVRWIHPEYGFMSPGEFIPLFEKNGFITKLDLYILEQVCKDIQRWKKKKYPFVPVSVNVSRRDFLEAGCIDKQVQIIDGYGIEHAYIHMEVTESLYSENTEIIISQLKRVQELGFMIEMDDFGSGYSSLGLLSSFPLNVIKLDISFVRNFRENEIVIENVIKMAHRLGLLTVAEGAETNEQVATLKTLGCDFIQGFYFSKPLSIADYEKYINDVEVLRGGKKVQTANLEELEWHQTDNVLLAANEVAEAVPGGFFSYHADGDLEIISFNKQLMEMYACKTAEEFREYTGNSFKGIVYKDDFDYVQKSINSQIKVDNDLDYVEYRIKAKDGTVKYVKDYGRFVKTKKYGDIFYVFVNDVTEEERWRADVTHKMIQNMELEQTVNLVSTEKKAKDIFIDNVIKDILYPVTSIIDCTESIKANLTNPVIVNEKINTAKTAEEHLLGFINNLRELSEIERNNIQLIEAPTDISDAAVKIRNLIKDAAEKKRITLEVWTEIYNPYIYQDVVHTTDVVLNILMNAVKYTPVGGKIKFGLKQSPGKNEKECTIDFICEDNGIGISKKFLPHVCTPFAREDNKINKENPSAGLGLHIAKKLLILMDGTIEITPKKGKGVIVKTSQPHRFAKKEDIEKETVLTQNVRL